MELVGPEKRRDIECLDRRWQQQCRTKGALTTMMIRHTYKGQKLPLLETREH